MSCLTERERAALEDIFLSISVNQSPFEKCRLMCVSYAPRLKNSAKRFATLLQTPQNFQSYKQAKIMLRHNRHRLRQKLGFFRHH